MHLPGHPSIPRPGGEVGFERGYYTNFVRGWHGLFSAIIPKQRLYTILERVYDEIRKVSGHLFHTL